MRYFFRQESILATKHYTYPRTYVLYTQVCANYIRNYRAKSAMTREKDRLKFVELAEKRVGRALKDIKLIGNLSNKSNYSYTEEDVKKIHSALKKAVEDMHQRFRAKGRSEDETFKL